MAELLSAALRTQLLENSASAWRRLPLPQNPVHVETCAGEMSLWFVFQAQIQIFYKKK